MRPVAWLAIALVSASQFGAAQKALQLPDRLKDYCSWRTAAPHPFPVPYDLWIQCVHPTPDQEARALREHGPHEALAVQVFTNSLASSVFHSEGPQTFPAGSIVVKEKYAGGGGPVAVAR